MKPSKRRRCRVQSSFARTSGARFLSSWVPFILVMNVIWQGVVGFRSARNLLMEKSQPLSIPGDTDAPVLLNHHGREIIAASDLAYVLTGLDFIRSLADPAVKFIRIASELVRIPSSAWDAAGFNIPLLVGRNVTVEGDPRFEDWPSLSPGNVFGKVRLMNEVALKFTHVNLVDVRDNPSRAPGMDFISPTLAGEVSYIILDSLVLITPVCFPGRMRPEDFDGLPRPEQFPGVQQNLFSIPQVGCINDTQAPPMKRCWPDRGFMKDMIAYGADIDPLTSTTIRNNLIILAFNATVVCNSLVDEYCLRDLNKAPLVCFTEAVQQYHRSRADADAVGSSGMNRSPRLSGAGGPEGNSAGGMTSPLSAARASSEAGHSKKATRAAVIGASVGGILLLIAVSVALLLVLRRHRNRCGKGLKMPAESSTFNSDHGGLRKALDISLPPHSFRKGETREGKPQTTCSDELSALSPADDKPSYIATEPAVILESCCQAAAGQEGQAAPFSPPESRVDQTARSTFVDISADEPLGPQPPDLIYQANKWKPNVNRDTIRKGKKSLTNLDLPVTPFTPPRAEVALDVRLLAAAARPCLEKGHLIMRGAASAAASAVAAGKPSSSSVDLAASDLVELSLKEMPQERIGGHQAGSSSAKCVATSTITNESDVMPGISGDNGFFYGLHGNSGTGVEDGGDGGSGILSHVGTGPPTVQLLPLVLGKGSFGRVMEGLYNGRRVAVKVIVNNDLGIVWGSQNRLAEGAAAAAAAAPLKDQQQQQHQPAGVIDHPSNAFVRSFEHEVQVLSRCQHPNIVQLLAACVTPPRLCLVMELMETSLERLMYHDAVQTCMMPLQKVLTIGIGISSALAYLHPTIVHRDLKPANVLINNPGSDQPVIKLSDFGLSRLRTTVKSTKSAEAGTPPYMPPECFDLETNRISHQADIYSLGVLIWEMLAGKRPWSGMSAVAIAFVVTYRGARPPLHELPCDRCPPKLARLLTACWDTDPARRPAAAEVSKELTLALQQLWQESSIEASAGAAATGSTATN